MEGKNTDKRIYFEHLDVIRFIAAFMIVIAHAYECWKGWYGDIPILLNETTKEFNAFGKLVNQFIGNFSVGVDIFFLISGFLITYILLEERKRHGRIHIGKFMMRRTLRIWPLYYFLVLASPFLVNWMDTETPHYLANALFIGNFEIINSERWSYPFAHFWSICIEEHFYLIWPFVIQYFSNKKLLLVFIGFIITSIAFRMWSFVTLEYSWYTLYLHTLSRIDVLIIGAVGAYFYSKKPFTLNLPRVLRVLILLGLIAILSIEPISAWPSIFQAGFKKFAFVILLSLLLLDYNFNPKFKHLLPNKSFIHYLGKVSYGMYMYHNILLLIIIKKVMWRFDISNIWAFFGITITLCIVVPIISYELFEKHFLKLGTRFRVVQTDR